MFKDKEWIPVYNSYTNDIVKSFYIPIFEEAISCKRASGYFSAKALASYAKGLEKFKKNKGTYKLIVSYQLSEEDYQEILLGHTLKEAIVNEIINSLDETTINEDELKNISNLAYLIAIGVIEIKIAFTKKGIFHDKFMIFTDSNGNKIYAQGSNNETYAAIDANYESFNITCSWLSSTFDYQKIIIQEKTFDEIWNNKKKGIYSSFLPDAVRNKILSFNNGKIIYDPIYLKRNTLIFDMVNEKYVIANNLNDKASLVKKALYKIHLKKFIANYSEDFITLNKDDSIEYVKNAFNIFKTYSSQLDFKVIMSDRLKKYLEEKELFIQNRYRLGASIKRHDEIVQEPFENFKSRITPLFSRQLREKQLWDAFFMYSMKKSSNFSVPGSGKTSSVLGVFAYLNFEKIVDRILMIGPKNSFISWRDEFKACFEDNIPLKCLSIDNPELYSSQKKKEALKKSSSRKVNLILVNYEIVQTLHDELKEIASSKTLLVFDEVHKIKGIDGKYANACLSISKGANYVITLTGTPIPNSYLDIYNNLNLLFPNDYMNFFGFTPKQLKNPDLSLIEEINDKINPFFCRTTKEQLRVPPCNKDIIIEIEGTSAESQILDILKDKYRKNQFGLVIRLLQLESNPKMLLDKIDLSDFQDILSFDETIQSFDYVDYSEDIKELIDSIDETSKFKATVDLASELVSQGKSVIIWCIFRNSISRLKSHLAICGINAEEITGSTSSEERETIIQNFKSKDIDVLITNPHTLAESVSLHQNCHDAIYFEYSYNLVHLLQSKDRIHRLGLKKGTYTQYYFMETIYDNYSLDKRIYRRLLDKEENMLEAIERNVLENVYATNDDVTFVLGDLLNDD
ncbi:ATP-dependent RNA helicase [Faecalicoccus pleomorphus]|uniref:ATP-dependent RNA helicase n=1 Tax=Faecalicoccus pleomorphus TaxID=1323 RepID=A0A380LH84_9FIRM|nr:SNF2-related protein [Faecalicoccus pleomorphus]SUO03198.1 ATP-dependent RNA helicase [Faecalicoccus pleomorphus]